MTKCRKIGKASSIVLWFQCSQSSTRPSSKFSRPATHRRLSISRVGRKGGRIVVAGPSATSATTRKNSSTSAWYQPSAGQGAQASATKPTAESIERIHQAGGARYT